LLANAGFRIFPARPERKTAGGWNKPPYIAGWHSLATTDRNQIVDWWKQFADAIPAICCDGIIVIDADRHTGGADGVAALAALVNQHGEWPDHPVIFTPGGGEHHPFRQPNAALSNGTGRLSPGIDVRGVGGYIVGEGAMLPDGTEWRADSRSKAFASQDALPQLPNWLEKIIRADKIQRTTGIVIGNQSVTHRELRFAEAALERGINEIATAPKGRRNTTLNNVAYRMGRMVARDWIDRNRVENCLLFAASELTKEDGLTAVLATIKSGLNAGLRKPHPDLVDRKWGGK